MKVFKGDIISYLYYVLVTLAWLVNVYERESALRILEAVIKFIEDFCTKTFSKLFNIQSPSMFQSRPIVYTKIFVFPT